MIGTSYGLNRGLLHVAARLHVLSSKYPTSTGLRLSATEQAWLHSLYEGNSKALTAWDKIPVSILRYDLHVKQNLKELPEDQRFARAALNSTLVTEACTYINASKSDPLLVFGVPYDIYSWYNNLDLMTRIRICDNPKFEVKIRIDPKKLSTASTPSAALYNTMLILSTELNKASANLPHNESYDGIIEDFGNSPHEIHLQRKSMLIADIRQIYIVNATGADERELNTYRKTLERRGEYKPGKKSKGRMPDPSRVYSENHVALSFYMLLYKMLGKGTKHSINTRAAIHAYRHLKYMMSFMGFSPSEIPHINECFTTMTGVIQGFLIQSQCENTSMFYIQRPDKPVTCACYSEVCQHRRTIRRA